MRSALPFENDVKMYGIQTGHRESQERREFENDVKMYGIQTKLQPHNVHQIVWEWCKNVWYSNCFGGNRPEFWFENDVKMYDIQTEEYPQGTYFIVWEWYKIV